MASRRHLIFGGALVASVLAVAGLRADTFQGIQLDRRIEIAYRVDAAALQKILPSSWRVSPAGPGPTEGANFWFMLVERQRDEGPDAKLRYNGSYTVVLRTLARHPITGEIVTVVVGGFGQTPASAPGFYKVQHRASFTVERSVRADAQQERIAESWLVEGLAAGERLEVRLEATPDMKTRTRDKTESSFISARDAALARVYRFDMSADVVRSAPVHIDLVRNYSLTFTSPEFGTLFDGSEQLISIRLIPWYLRQTFSKD